MGDRIMRGAKLLIVLVTGFALASAEIIQAQIPRFTNVQGVLRDDAGNLITEAADLEFRIYDKSGQELYLETHTGVQVNNGLFSVHLGSVDPAENPLDLSFDKPYELGIAIGIGGQEMTPRRELTTVPYSFNALSVLGDSNVFPGSGKVGIGTTTPSAQLDVVGSTELNGDVIINGSTTLQGLTSIEGPLDVNGPLEAMDINVHFLDVMARITTDDLDVRDRLRVEPGGSLEVMGPAILDEAVVGKSSVAGDSSVGGDLTVTRIDTGTGLPVEIFAVQDLLDEDTGEVLGDELRIDTALVANGDVTINSNLAVDTNLLFVDGTAGKVGIGTTSPGYKFDLHVPAGTDAIRIRRSDLANDVVTIKSENGNEGTLQLLNDGLLGTRITATGDSYFKFGNVGIGTTTPSTKLDVAGTVMATAFVGDGSGLTGIAKSTSPGNLTQIALLRWYEANESGTTFNVGNYPRSVAFDGANIWVTNYYSNTVTKLRASDGDVQGTFNVGSNPYGVAFDGANIWVANYGSDTVTKLRASDGDLQGTFNVGSSSAHVAFDGANIWVANHLGHTVSKL